ncbi:MAG: LamG domain-containing protein, partial [Inquilinus sp.]|nr:LamG domain-containing protein [Inquilinus sp.]
MLRLVGYSDRLSVAPGEDIAFMVSADGLDRYEAAIVRLIHGDANPDGPGFRADPVASTIEGGYDGRFQEIRAGSYVAVPDHPALRDLASFTVAAMIWPTLPGSGRQALIAKGGHAARAGFSLDLDEAGALSLTLVDDDGGTVALSSGKPMLARHWYLAAAAFDAESGRVTLVQRPLKRFALTDDEATTTAETAIRPANSGTPLTIAAGIAEIDDRGPRTAAHYDGKIDSPMLFGRALGLAELNGLFGPSASREGLVAGWDFSREMRSIRAVDSGPHGLHGTCVNLPARAMKGWNWTGTEMNWTRAPEQYGAIHFHRDDLYDAGWQADFVWTVPEGTRSGVYCAHIRSADGAHEDYLPFAGRPPRGEATAEIAFLMPTASYLAYANDHNSVDGEAAEMLMGRLIKLQPGDLFIDEHREYGLATYDTHADGSGVRYSSR